MAEFSSPNVSAVERDYTSVAKVTGSGTGGTVGAFKWGYAETVASVSSENELLSTFGKPDNSNYMDWFCAANFLAYTSSLRLVRVVDNVNSKNSSTGAAVTHGILIKNPVHLEVVKSTGLITEFFSARCVGKLGDTLDVHVADSTTFDTWQFKDLFDTAPSSSGALSGSVEPALDEIHVVVTDRNGLFTGTNGQVLEKFAYLSKAKDAVGADGQASYYVNAINNRSAYIYALATISGDAVEDIGLTHSAFGGKLSDGKPLVALSEAYVGSLSGGSDGDVPTTAEYVNAFDILTNDDQTDISLLFVGGAGGDANHSVVSNAVIGITTKRGDMLAFISPKFSDVVGVVDKSTVITNLKATVQGLSLKNSFAVMTTGYKLQYDKYNDLNRWIAGNGDDAGLCALTENEYDVWVSPAGYTRGHYRNCTALAFNPDQDSRDTLYKVNINPVVTFPKDGTILYGDKTLQGKNSAFSWIGIRRLFISLKKGIKESAKYSLFEFNDQFTRQRFKDEIEPLLREIKGRRGVDDYYVRCDETNNSSDVIQKGEFVADIIIKPMYSIQSIRLSFTAIRREVNFDEVISS